MNGRRLGYVLKRFPRLSETFVAAEILELQRQGEDVWVFATSRPDEPVRHRFLEELTAPVVYLPYRPSRQPLRVARALARALRSNPSGWFRAAQTSLFPPRLTGLRRLLQATVLFDEMRRAGVTHAHAHFATAAARLANLAWRMGLVSYSVTAHAKDIWHQEVRVDHLRDKLAPARFVATVSEVNRAYLVSQLGPGTRVEVVPNSVDVGRLVPGQRRPQPRRVLSVARLVEKKGLHHLLEACAVLARRGRPVELEIVGDGPQRSGLEAAASAAGLNVHFMGALPHEAVVARYLEASVFCLPCVVASTGDRDGLPTAVLEAMALGVPVVASAVNGLSEAIVHERTGLVVPNADPPGLADALDRLLTDPGLATRLSVAGRRHVEERFALGSTVARLRALFPQAA